VTDEFRPASGDFRSGTQVAGYRIEEPIGHGGMAVVYRALDIKLERWVALKILAPEIASDESFRQRFIGESRAAAAVDHPHVIPVFEAGEADGVLFIAMRYVGGGDVRTLLGQLGPMDAMRVCTIINQVASALDAAHASRLVHRDVKPANMLLGAVAGSGHPDHIYLSDFGLSKESLSAAGLTMAGQFLGTLDYIAPEQIEGRPVDGRADLYALACAAFELLSGTPPFTHDQKEALIWAHLSEAPPPLSARRADLPPAVDWVMAKALAKSPDDRYGSCLEFSASLRTACGLESGPGAQRPSGPPRAVTELARPSQPAGPPDGPAQPAGLPDGRAQPAGLPETAHGPVQPVSPPTSHDHVPDQRWSAAPAATQAARVSDWPQAAERGPSGPPSSWPPPPPSRLTSPPGPPRRRPRAAIAVTVLVILAIAIGAFALLRVREQAAQPIAGNSPSTTPSTGKPASSKSPTVIAGPAATVRAYYTAINNKDYARAWSLGARNIGQPYQSFVNGYNTTARDTVTILSVTGNVVTAHLSALQTDGTVRTFQGTYTIQDGVITKFDVR